MTDINKIIGRALLNVEAGEYEDYYGLIAEDDDPDRIVLCATASFTDIGAAVVKALDEAGYAVAPKEANAAMKNAYYDFDGDPNAGEAWAIMVEAAIAEANAPELTPPSGTRTIPGASP